MSDKPCSNPDCDLCHPLPWFKVSTITVRRIVHEREIKAATPEEALRIYNEGTGWPSSYDERTIETLSESPVTVERDDKDLSFMEPDWRCHKKYEDDAATPPTPTRASPDP